MKTDGISDLCFRGVIPIILKSPSRDLDLHGTLSLQIFSFFSMFSTWNWVMRTSTKNGGAWMNYRTEKGKIGSGVGEHYIESAF